MEVACFQLVHGFTNRWWKSVFNQALAKGRDREQEIVMPYWHFTLYAAFEENSHMKFQ